MMPHMTPTRVLITVKTYPTPSQKYRETVCTAGITEYGEWVRLYPIPFRYLARTHQFEKYQWVEVKLVARGAGGDSRKESRRPDCDSFRLHGAPLDTRNNWAERKRIIEAMPHHTLLELRQLYTTARVSLGIVRPTRILDVKIEIESADWKPGVQKIFNQMALFGGATKLLRKLPYKFSYVFECADSKRPHTAMITDWELGALFWGEVARLGSSAAAAESVRHKFLNVLCAANLDTRFFMGTVLPHNSWIVLGVFYPKKPVPKWETIPLTLPGVSH